MQSLLGRRHRRLFSVLAAVLTVAVLEGIAFAACAVLQHGGYFFFEPAAPDIKLFLARHDPVLGWGARPPGGRPPWVWDRIGSRHVPAFANPDLDVAAVSLYGDSWTWGYPVSADEAYGNVLAKRIGRRVNNFGIVGYGTDQACVRFMTNDRDQAQVVVLGHLSENIIRNVTQFLDLIYPASGYGLKPRFVLDHDGHAELVPPPRLDTSQFWDLGAHPERYLKHEFFLPGGAAGITYRRFPYVLSAVSVLRNFRMQAALRKQPRWAEFYAPDHPSEALGVTVAVMETFIEHAQDIGKEPVIAVFPTGEDLTRHASTGRWTYQPLLDELDRRAIPYCHSGTSLVRQLGDREPSTYFTGGEIDAHPNAKGYAALARSVYECLEAGEVLSTPP